MTGSTFDTLAAARELEAAGLEARQAEAIAAQLRTAAGADHAGLATKLDLAGLESRLVKWGIGPAFAVIIIPGVIIRWP